jgi:hypothetical protein
MAIALAGYPIGNLHACEAGHGEVVAPAPRTVDVASNRQGGKPGRRTSRSTAVAPMTRAAITKNKASGGEVA